MENYNEDNELESDENWVIYFSFIEEDLFASILVDLDLDELAPVKEKSFLISTSILMNSPTEDGLSSSEESEILNAVEDRIIGSVGEKCQSIYAGRVNSQGKIRSFFYAEATEKVEDIILEIKNEFPNYKIEYEISEDEDWSAYFDILYPQPIEMQSIQNRLVIENLEENGDDLTKERPVDHWIYFQSEKDRNDFLSEIENDGFEVVEKSKDNDLELPYTLQLTRVDKVDYENADEHTIYLWQKAQDFNGEYDGWETFVIKG